MSESLGGPSGGPVLTVAKGVIVEVARLATLEVPEVLRVGRGGPAWRRLLSGSPIQVKVHDPIVEVRVWLIARPGSDLVATADRVRANIGAAMQRLLQLTPATVTVFVDGVGG
ncbi:MAG TPA: Asp23/Gls24 family envelope stress response protein [Candidatus Limnocylindrales bacterium]